MPHIHDKVDFTVEVLVVYQNKVLLRKHDKYGIWLSVGGHIELDEDPTQAAVREVKEEVGLNIELVGNPLLPNRKREGYEELLPPKYMNRHRISDTHEHVTLTYFAKSSSDAVVPENEGEEWRWVTADELKDPVLNLNESILLYAQEALTELSS